MRVIPNVFKVVHFLEHEECVVRLATLPYKLLKLFGSEDDEVRLCLQEQLEIREIQLEGSYEAVG